MGGHVKRASYDNSGRLARSQATRRRILEVSRELLLERGYRATTIAEIARRADVHVDTVYELVGRKPVLLRELIELAISGADQAVDAEQRDYVVALRAEPDPRRKLAIYARATREIHGRMAPLLMALRDAATTDPDAQQVWDDIAARRAANMRKLAADLGRAGGLRTGLSVDEAGDTIWATNSAELYLLLTGDRGWSPEHYEAWLADLWARVLLPPEPIR